ALLRSGNHGRTKVEMNFATEEGGRVPVYCSISAVELGDVQCLCLVATDLTGQKRNEEIMASERLARRILEHAGNVIVVCDERGVITHASGAAHEMAGTNILHQPFESVFRLALKNGAVDSASVAKSDSNGSFVSHCLGGETFQSAEVELHRSDGKKFDLLMSAGPLRDSREQSLGCVFTLTDISRLKQAEQTQALLAAIVESSGDAIISKSPDGIITSWNKAAERIFGYSAQEMIGRSITVIIPPERLDEERSILEQLCRGERIEHYETVRVSKDGRAIDVSLTISPIQDATGRIVGASKVARDITARRRMEDALRESEERLRRQAQELEQQLIASGRLVSLGEITASMAHEFNNPLGIVMGFAEDLLSEKEPSSPDYQALKIIHSETKRCEKIIGELLQFARPRAADFGPTDLPSLIARTLELVGGHLYKQKIESDVRIEEDLPEMHADRQQLEQVLVNLYLNAIDAMPEGGKLIVEGRLSPSGEIVISTGDTGMGIGPEDLPRIFQPFFSARKKRGLGLGLSICNRIIKNHGGRIEVESRPHQGTTFAIFLPVQRTADAGASDLAGAKSQEL
ncbi:MAG: PAS domain-containing sensor histidine kinase, partial [Candidatus Binatia bacterium]